MIGAVRKHAAWDGAAEKLGAVKGVEAANEQPDPNLEAARKAIAATAHVVGLISLDIFGALCLDLYNHVHMCQFMEESKRAAENFQLTSAQLQKSIDVYSGAYDPEALAGSASTAAKSKATDAPIVPKSKEQTASEGGGRGTEGSIYNAECRGEERKWGRKGR